MQRIKCHFEYGEKSPCRTVLRSNAFGDVANARCEIKTSSISLAKSQHSPMLKMTLPFWRLCYFCKYNVYFKKLFRISMKKKVFVYFCLNSTSIMQGNA